MNKIVNSVVTMLPCLLTAAVFLIAVPPFIVSGNPPINYTIKAFGRMQLERLQPKQKIYTLRDKNTKFESPEYHIESNAVYVNNDSYYTLYLKTHFSFNMEPLSLNLTIHHQNSGLYYFLTFKKTFKKDLICETKSRYLGEHLENVEILAYVTYCTSLNETLSPTSELFSFSFDNILNNTFSKRTIPIVTALDLERNSCLKEFKDDLLQRDYEFEEEEKRLKAYFKAKDKYERNDADEDNHSNYHFRALIITALIFIICCLVFAGIIQCLGLRKKKPTIEVKEPLYQI